MARENGISVFLFHYVMIHPSLGGIIKKNYRYFIDIQNKQTQMSYIIYSVHNSTDTTVRNIRLKYITTMITLIN